MIFDDEEAVPIVEGRGEESYILSIVSPFLRELEAVKNSIYVTLLT